PFRQVNADDAPGRPPVITALDQLRYGFIGHRHSPFGLRARFGVLSAPTNASASWPGVRPSASPRATSVDSFGSEGRPCSIRKIAALLTPAFWASASWVKPA